MSRTRRGRKGTGYEFWSRRSRVPSFGSEAKRITKKQERTDNKALQRLAIQKPEEVRNRFPGE